jgi:O-methyltransferase
LLSTETSSTPLRRVLRQASLIDLFGTTATIDGAVAECGCARGMSFMQLCCAAQSVDRAFRGERFFVLDSFEGLSEPVAQDMDTSGMSAGEAKRVLGMTYKGSLSYPFDDVSKVMLREFPEVSIHKGWIPAVLGQLPDATYRFVHVDVDLFEPTLSCFEYFFPRLAPGGIVLTDDYGWPGGRRAVEAFAQRHGLEPLLTATKQAYFVR